MTVLSSPLLNTIKASSVKRYGKVFVLVHVCLQNEQKT
jgi:hypothetical protein